MISMQARNLNHLDLFTETGMNMIEKLLGELTKRCKQRCKDAEVTSIIKTDGISGPEYEISIFDNGILDCTFRVYRDMQTGRIEFVRLYIG